MGGRYVHQIDPVFFDINGICFWWYGMIYPIGFLGILFWFGKARDRLLLTKGEVYDLTLLTAACSLLFGRGVEVVFYEWEYYGSHLEDLPRCWIGGMSTHGVLLGGVVGIALFCAIRKKSFLLIADEMAIPGAFLMGVGRLGNFVDGQIVGSLSELPWAVKFPDAEGYRHPVVLYDSIKNFLIIPMLLLVMRLSGSGRGLLFANFLFWYGSIRIFIDLFRDYPVHIFGFPPGQYFNLCMGIAGALLIGFFSFRRRHPFGQTVAMDEGRYFTPRLRWERGSFGRGFSLWWRRFVLLILLLFPLMIPSDWTQNVPEKYGKRHVTQYSSIYRLAR